MANSSLYHIASLALLFDTGKKTQTVNMNESNTINVYMLDAGSNTTAAKSGKSLMNQKHPNVI